MPKILYRFVDSFYAVFGFSLMYLHKDPPKSYLENKSNEYSIIILQGVFNRWGFMKKMADDISSLGYSVHVLPQLGNNTKKISDTAKIVNEFIHEKDLKNIIIVGHSKGGLVGKYLLANLDEGKRVKGLVSIATPFHGTYEADRFKLLKVNEFDPKHETIKKLNDQREVNNKIITISPSFDNVVVHEKSGTLNGAFDNLYVKVAGHHKIVFDKETKEKIIESIEKLSKTN